MDKLGLAEAVAFRQLRKFVTNPTAAKSEQLGAQQ
jgi:hypothetical protein